MSNVCATEKSWPKEMSQRLVAIYWSKFSLSNYVIRLQELVEISTMNDHENPQTIVLWFHNGHLKNVYQICRKMSSFYCLSSQLSAWCFPLTSLHKNNTTEVSSPSTRTSQGHTGNMQPTYCAMQTLCDSLQYGPSVPKRMDDRKQRSSSTTLPLITETTWNVELQ